MKKTLISALILTALFTTTGCEDKEAKATIAQQTQTIAQLTAKNTQLKAEKEIAESVWKSWNQDYLQAVAKHPGGPVELYADPSLNLSRKALRIDLLDLEHKILDRLSKIKK